MDERMTVCNMSIEAGARAGLIAPDDTTIEYCKNRKYAPKGEEFEKAAAEWKALKTDPGAVYDHSIVLDGSEISPMVTWGVNPGMVLPVDAQIPAPETIDSEDGKKKPSARTNTWESHRIKKLKILKSSMCLSAPVQIRG